MHLLAEDRGDEPRDSVQGQAHILHGCHVRCTHTLFEGHGKDARFRLLPDNGGDLGGIGGMEGVRVGENI